MTEVFAAAGRIAATLDALAEALLDERATRYPLRTLSAFGTGGTSLFGHRLSPNGPGHQALPGAGRLVEAGTVRRPVRGRSAAAVSALMARYGAADPVRGVPTAADGPSADQFQLPVLHEAADELLCPPFTPALAAFAAERELAVPEELATGGGSVARLIVPSAFHPLTVHGPAEPLAAHLAEVAEELFAAEGATARRDFAVLSALLAEEFATADVVFAGLCALQADDRPTHASLTVSITHCPQPLGDLALALADERPSAEVWTVLLPAGPAVVLVEPRTAPVPAPLTADGQRRWVVSSVVEAFLPLPDGASVLGLQLSTAQPDDWELYADVFAAILGSIEVGWDGVPVAADVPGDAGVPVGADVPGAAAAGGPAAAVAEAAPVEPGPPPVVQAPPVAARPAETGPAPTAPAAPAASAVAAAPTDPAKGTPVRVPPADFNPFAAPAPSAPAAPAPVAVAPSAFDPFGPPAPAAPSVPDPFGPPAPAAPSALDPFGPPTPAAPAPAPVAATPAEAAPAAPGKGTPVKVPPADFNPFAPPAPASPQPATTTEPAPGKGTPVKVPPADFNPFAALSTPSRPTPTPAAAAATPAPVAAPAPAAAPVVDPFGTVIANEPQDPFGTVTRSSGPAAPPAPATPPVPPMPSTPPAAAAPPAPGKGTPVRVPPADFNPFAPPAPATPVPASGEPAAEAVPEAPGKGTPVKVPPPDFNPFAALSAPPAPPTAPSGPATPEPPAYDPFG